MFEQLSMSIRTYATKQGIHPSLVTRYLKGDVMPSEEFCRDLADEVKLARSAVADVPDRAKLAKLYRSARDAQPRGWGNATRLRREAATASRRAQQATRDLGLIAEQLADAHRRIAELEQGRGTLDSSPVRKRPSYPRPYWDHYRTNHLARSPLSTANVTSIDDTTDRIIDQLADPASKTPLQTKGRVLIPPQTGKSSYVTALATKSLDAGYRLLVVLSDPLNAIRAQLQARLEESLDHAPQGKTPPLRLTTQDSDYRSLAALLPALEFEKRVPSLPLNDPRNLDEALPRVLVVKKNASILRRLIGDLQRIRTPLEEVPTLILDTADAKALQGGAIENLTESLRKTLPRSQYVTFENITQTDEETRPDFMMWVPKAEIAAVN